MQRSALLFCPPQPPLRLESDRSVVIGRHRSCDLPLRRTNISRRHAEVSFDGQFYVVKDLNSTNGTFVNGERIEGSHRLRPGDRIEISACEVTYCELSAEAVSLDEVDAATLHYERPERDHALEGDLAEIPAFALLQLLDQGGKSGVLEVCSGERPGRIWLSRGAPVHAETEKREGFDAALEVLSGRSGRFRFVPGTPPSETTIETTLTELLLESTRRLDED